MPIARTILAANQIKKLFDLKVLRYETILKKDGYRFKLISNGSLFKIKHPSDELKEEIRKNVAFRWILGLKPFTKVCIFYNAERDSSHCVSIQEHKIYFEDNDFSIGLLNKYYDGNWNNFINLVKCMIDEIGIEFFCSQVEQIIEDHDPEEMWWSLEIARRVRNLYT